MVRGPQFEKRCSRGSSQAIHLCSFHPSFIIFCKSPLQNKNISPKSAHYTYIGPKRATPNFREPPHLIPAQAPSSTTLPVHYAPNIQPHDTEDSRPIDSLVHSTNKIMFREFHTPTFTHNARTHTKCYAAASPH